MSKKKVYNYTRRTLAFLMAMIMTLSVVQSSSMTAFAQTGSDVVVTEATDVIEETETMVSNTEEESEAVSEDAMEESAVEPVSTEVSSEAEEISSEVVEETTEVIETTEAETVIEAVETEEEESVSVVEVIEVGSGSETYTGEVSEDGTTLSVSENGVVAAGGTFDDATIIDILTTRANASERYETVMVEYNSITDVVSQDLWNAFVSIGVNTAVVCFDGGANPDERWTFYYPTSSSMGDSSLAVDIFVTDDGNVGFSREYINYSCTGGAVLELCLDDLETQAEWFENFKAAYGEESIEYLEIRDEDNEERSSDYGASYSYSDEACSLTINFGDTYGSTSFSLHKPHMGYERTEDGRSVFVIDEHEMPSNADFTNDAVAILEANDKLYDVIELNYRPNYEGLCEGSVYETLWNKACSKLNEGTADAPSQIRANFSGGEMEADENWCIDNPTPLVDDSMFLDVTFTPSTTEAGGASFVIEGYSAPRYESNICVNFCVDENGRKSIYDTYVTAFGTESMQLELNDAEGNLIENTNGDYQYNTEENNNHINICINGVNQLNRDESYSVVERIYRGDLNSWEEDGQIMKNLYIHPGNVNKDSFTADEIANILSYYEEGSLNEITIVFLTEETAVTVDDAIINAALPYVKNTEERAGSIAINIQNPTTHRSTIWILEKPAEQTEDQTLSTVFTVSSVSGNGGTISVGSQTLKAEHINLRITRNATCDGEGYEELKSAFGGADTDLSIGNTDVYSNFRYDDYEAWIWISDVDDLKVDTSYDIVKKIYKGQINTWPDGTRELNIHSGMAGVETFTEDQLNEILDYYSKEDNIEYIYIGQARTDNNIIYKSVADKAASLLCNEEYGEVKFGFRDIHTDQEVEWQLAGKPSEIVQTANQTVSANLIVSEANEEQEDALYVVSAGAQALVAPEVRVLFNTSVQNPNEPADEFIIGLFGEEAIQIETEGSETPGWYYVNDEHVCIGLGDPRALTADQPYKIIKKEYRGEVHEEYDEEGNVIWSDLYISAHGIDKDLFDAESFGKIVDYWNERGVKFDHVSVEQSYTNNNIVNKDIFNLALGLLANSSEQELTFVFCRCQMAEQNENGEEIKPFIQSDMNWTFQNITGDAAKNINANAKVTGKGGAGVSVVLPSNSYPCENTYLSFWMNEEAEMVQNVLIPSFGKAKTVSENDPYAGQLLVLEKASTLKSTDHARYERDSYDESMINFSFNNVEDLTPGIDNRLVEAIYRREAAVGKEIWLPLFSYDPNDPEDPGYPPEEGDWEHPDRPKSNIKFKLLTPEYATLANYDKLTPTAPWEMVYTLCTYTSVSGKTCLEVLGYPTIAVVDKMSFEQDVYTIDLGRDDPIDRDGDEWNDSYRDFLQVNILPVTIQSHINPQEFEWHVSGNSIALVENDYYIWDEEILEDVYAGTRPNGEFVVTGYGETKITVSYDGKTAECIVNVLEPIAVPEIPTVYIVPAIDVKLSDIDPDVRIKNSLAEAGIEDVEGTFEWVDGSIKLNAYADLYSHGFAATYKVEGREPVQVTIPTDIIRITDIGLYAAFAYEDEAVSGNMIKGAYELNNSSVALGDDLIVGHRVMLNHDGSYEALMALNDYYIATGKLVLSWDEKTSKMLTAIDPESEEYTWYSEVQRPHRYTATQKDKKTFTYTATNALTNKAIVKSSATVMVTANELFDIHNGFSFVDSDPTETAMTGDFIFTIDKDNYANAKSLKIKSADESVLKLGSAVVTPADQTESGDVVIVIPYTFKKEGNTVLKVSSEDEMKTSTVIEVGRIDYEPKLSATSFTLDKTWKTNEGAYQADGYLDIFFRQEDTALTGMATLSCTDEKYQDAFTLYAVDDDYSQGLYYICMNDDTNIKKNTTVDLTVNIPYSINGTPVAEPCKIGIKVKVIESKPKATIRQTQNINEFYNITKYSAGEGYINMKSSEYDIYNVRIVGESVFDIALSYGYGKDNTYCVFAKEQPEEKLTADQKKITIAYTLSNVDKYGVLREYNGEKQLTLVTETKKPSLAFTQKSNTFYPAIDSCYANLMVYDTKTKGWYSTSEEIEVKLTTADGASVTISENSIPLKVGKNEYYVTNEYGGICITLISFEPVKATDKFKFTIQGEDWSQAVSLEYKAKVDVTTPKLMLSNKTLTLNANDVLYKTQSVQTSLMVKGFGDNLYNAENIKVSAVKDVSVLNNNLSIRIEGPYIYVSVINNKVENADGTFKQLKGNYKFKVYATINGKPLSTDLTIKIVDTAPEKAIKVTKKGSIDVLRRDTTGITFNPKTTNLVGYVVDMYLAGPDADKFQPDYGYKVKANDGHDFSTKASYTVIPVYVLYDYDTNITYEVAAAPQKIKVTQGKPKVTVTTNTNTLYADKNTGVEFDFSAMLNNEGVDIRNVELLNYTNDLEWNDEAYVLKLGDWEPTEIIKAKKNYKLKFAVTFEDGAGNVKATQVTYKLNIVR